MIILHVIAHRTLRHAVSALLALSISAPLAQAAPADYCAAYAQDFADATAPQGTAWDEAFARAKKDCLFQYTQQKKPDPVVVTPKVAEKKKPVAETQPAAVAPKAAAVVPKAAKQQLRPEPGSSAWNEYCSRKYASFNAETGTYRSFSGAERKCLVTSDFR